MDHEKLKMIIQEYFREIDAYDTILCKSDLGFRYYDILFNAQRLLTDNTTYITNLIVVYDNTAKNPYSRYSLETEYIIGVLNYILKLLSINFPDLIEKKILEDAQDKLKEAGISFENDDFSSVISKLNTGIELALKEELDIPMTISKINTRKILDICIAHNIGPKVYLPELIKHVIDVDNKIKHQGYNATKKDAINAISAFEGFIKKIKKYPFNVNSEIRDNIFSGL